MSSGCRSCKRCRTWPIPACQRLTRDPPAQSSHPIGEAIEDNSGMAWTKPPRVSALRAPWPRWPPAECCALQHSPDIGPGLARPWPCFRSGRAVVVRGRSSARGRNRTATAMSAIAGIHPLLSLRMRECRSARPPTFSSLPRAGATRSKGIAQQYTLGRRQGPHHGDLTGHAIGSPRPSLGLGRRDVRTPTTGLRFERRSIRKAIRKGIPKTKAARRLRVSIGAVTAGEHRRSRPPSVAVRSGTN